MRWKSTVWTSSCSWNRLKSSLDLLAANRRYREHVLQLHIIHGPNHDRLSPPGCRAGLVKSCRWAAFVAWLAITLRQNICAGRLMQATVHPRSRNPDVIRKDCGYSWRRTCNDAYINLPCVNRARALSISHPPDILAAHLPGMIINDLHELF